MAKKVTDARAREVLETRERPGLGTSEAEAAEFLGSLARRATQILFAARDTRDVMLERKWTAVHETLEGVCFNLERADLLLRNEARQLKRHAGVEDDTDA